MASFLTPSMLVYTQRCKNDIPRPLSICKAPVGPILKFLDRFHSLRFIFTYFFTTQSVPEFIFVIFCDVYVFHFNHLLVNSRWFVCKLSSFKLEEEEVLVNFISFPFGLKLAAAHFKQLFRK